MSDTKRLVERLQDLQSRMPVGTVGDRAWYDLLTEAVATIERLETENLRIRQRLLRAGPDPMRRVEQGNAAECLRGDIED